MPLSLTDPHKLHLVHLEEDNKHGIKTSCISLGVHNWIQTHDTVSEMYVQIWSHDLFSVLLVCRDSDGNEALVGFVVARAFMLHECDITDRALMGLEHKLLEHESAVYILTLGVISRARCTSISIHISLVIVIIIIWFHLYTTGTSFGMQFLCSNWQRRGRRSKTPLMLSIFLRAPIIDLEVIAISSCTVLLSLNSKSHSIIPARPFQPWTIWSAICQRLIFTTESLFLAFRTALQSSKECDRGNLQAVIVLHALSPPFYNLYHNLGHG